MTTEDLKASALENHPLPGARKNIREARALARFTRLRRRAVTVSIKTNLIA